METKFRVGVAREIITPPLGTVLYGYPDQRRATSIHDDLKLTAFAFESDNERLIMITADICAHGTDEVASLKKKISAKMITHKKLIPNVCDFVPEFLQVDADSTG